MQNIETQRVTLTDEQFNSLREFTFNNIHLPTREFYNQFHSWWETVLGWRPESVEHINDRIYTVYTEIE